MSHEENQARALADWLEAPPGTDPPEGVDDDVLEAIYALHPERAPAPRVSVDDILAGVGEGPLAGPVPVSTDAGDPVDAPTQEGSAVAPSAAGAVPGVPEPANRPMSGFPRWLLGGGIAALAAAALVGVGLMSPRFLGGPSVEQIDGGPLARRDEAPASTAAQAPPDAPKAASAPSGAGAKERSLDIALPDELESGGDADDVIAASGSAPAAEQEPAQDAVAGSGGLGQGSAGMGGGGSADGLGTLSRSDAPAGAGEAPAREKKAEVAGADDAAGDEADAFGDGGDAVADLGEAPDARSAPEDAEVVAELRTDGDAAPAPRSSRSRSAPREAAPMARAEVASEEAPGPAPSTDDLRRRAAPPGALSDDARRAKATLDQGDPEGARDAAEARLDASTLPPAAQADLHYVIGLAWLADGRTRPAERAFQEAIRLR